MSDLFPPSKTCTLLTSNGTVALLGTPKGVGSVKAGDQIHAGLEVPGKGLLAELRLKVQNREAGYEFKEG